MSIRPASSIRGSAWRLALSLTVALLALLPAVESWSLSRYAERAAYKRALDHLSAGRMSEFASLRKRLEDYPLRPYLDYYELQSQISSATPEAIRGFRNRYPELPVADIVFSRWLRSLGSQKRWDVFLDYYEPSSTVELRCYHLRALIGSGHRDAALDQVAEGAFEIADPVRAAREVDQLDAQGT